MAFHSLLDVFNFDPDGCRVVVLRLKTAVDIPEENAQNYLEVVSRREVKDMFFPFGDCRVVLAVFDESIKASTLQEWQDVTGIKTLEGETPTLTLLQRPQGIYLELPDSEITEEYLSLYFENRRSGGKEGTVQEARITHTAEAIHAVVQISSHEAIRSVLRKSDHRLGNRTVQVQPYYPEIHDDILTSEKRADSKPAVAVPGLNVMCRETSHSPAEPSVVKCLPLGRASPQQPAVMDSANPQVTHCLKPVSTLQIAQKTVLPSKPEILQDEEKLFSVDDTKDSGSSGFQKHQRVNAVKPVVRASFTGCNDESVQHKPKNKNDCKDDTTLSKNEEIKASPAKIIMLKIYHFKDKYETERLKFDFIEKQRKIVIRAASDQEVKEGKLRVHECFESLKSREEILSPARLLMMKQQSAQICLRERCKKRKIKATFEVEVDRKVIKWYGFSEIDIDEGLRFLKNEVRVKEIRLRPGQDRAIFSDAWKQWKEELEVDNICIYVDGQTNVITVECLLDKIAEELEKKIINFLKENIPKTQAGVLLEGGKAKVFKTSLESIVREKVQQYQGTFQIEEVSNSPLKLRILVEGEERLKYEFTKIVEQIWHEYIEFDRISDKDEDKWLMLRGLSGSTGKAFFRNFESGHKCVIEVSTRGNFILKQPKVKVREVSPARETGKNIAESGKLTKAENQRSDVQLEDEKRSQSRFSCQQAVLLQTGTEANQLATEESLKENSASQPRSYERERKDRHEQSFSNLRHLQLGQTEVVLKKGILVDQTADALVNVVSATGNFTDSTVSKAFVDRGGPQLEKMYMSADTDSRSVAVTTKASGGLLCTAVLHVKLKKGNPQNAVSEVMKEVLHQCCTSGHSSLALPPLGVGRMFRYPAKDVAYQILTEIKTLAQTQGQGNVLDKVLVVVYPKDDATFQDFESVFSSFNPGVLQRPASAPVSSHQQQPRSYQHGLHRQQKYQSHFSRQARSGDSRRSADDGQQRSSSDGFETPQNMTRQTEKEKAEHKKARKSRFPDDKPATHLHVVVIAENKDTCIKARNTLGKEIRAEYLYEEKLHKSQKISKESKEKIIKILTENDIKSFKDKDGYVLKGQREKVKDAHNIILQILLQDKDTVEDRRKRKKDAKRETNEFARVMYEEDLDVPFYWEEYKSGFSLKELWLSAKKLFKNDKFKSFALQSNSKQFAAIIRMINSKFDPTLVGKGKDATGLDQFKYSKLKVLRIERIENVELYDKYATRRQRMFGCLFKNGEVRFPQLQQRKSDLVNTDQFVHSVLDGDIYPEVNEVFLFHGTKNENVRVICNGGLDSRLGSGRAMYGSGIYGAECSQKADQYADDQHSRSAGRGQTKNMFLMRMLLGNAYICREQNPHKFCRPPCVKCFKDNCNDSRHARKFGHMFDSVVGDYQNRLFREFVVYESSQCYPEYLITYERI